MSKPLYCAVTWASRAQLCATAECGATEAYRETGMNSQHRIASTDSHPMSTSGK